MYLNNNKNNNKNYFYETVKFSTKYLKTVHLIQTVYLEMLRTLDFIPLLLKVIRFLFWKQEFIKNEKIESKAR